MVLRGHVEGQTFVLEKPSGLRDGTSVLIDVLESGDQVPGADDPESLYDELKDIIGTVSGLPSDLAENHDHYLYGTPKK